MPTNILRYESYTIRCKLFQFCEITETIYGATLNGDFDEIAQKSLFLRQQRSVYRRLKKLSGSYARTPVNYKDHFLVP